MPRFFLLLLPASVGALACGSDPVEGNPSFEDVSGAGGLADPSAGGSDAGGVPQTGGVVQSGGGLAGGGAPSGGQSSGMGGGMGFPDPVGGSPAAGGLPGSGGAPHVVDALLDEFDAYWDFQSSDPALIPPVVGDEALTSSGGLALGPWDEHLVLSGDPSSALCSAPVVNSAADFSVTAWVKLDALSDFDTFVAADGQQVSAFYLQKRNDERLSFTTFPDDSTTADSCVTTAEIQPRVGEWYQVTGTRDAATREQRIYVDGVLSARTICPEGVFQAAGGISVGRGLYDGQPSDFMNGAMDNLGLISRVLTPPEVFDLYQADGPDKKHYLFAYFVEVTEGRGDGLRLAHSHDGQQWGAIGSGKVFMPPSVGGGSFRDPHLMRDPSGMYHLVWTTTCVPWAESNCVQDRGLGYASSPDLVNWSAADYITVDLNVEHVWAPESFHDEASGKTMIFWSSPVDDNPAAADPHSIYYVLTDDFETFSDPAVLVAQPSRNLIDATIVAEGERYLMILKDEADGQKNLRALYSDELFGELAWTDAPSAPLTGNYAAEGPSILQRDGQLFVYFDKYGEGSYGALRATDAALDTPAGWQDVSEEVFFPGVRHGTPIEVPWSVFEAVALKAGE